MAKSFTAVFSAFLVPPMVVHLMLFAVNAVWTIPSELAHAENTYSMDLV